MTLARIKANPAKARYERLSLTRSLLGMRREGARKSRIQETPNRIHGYLLSPTYYTHQQNRQRQYCSQGCQIRTMRDVDDQWSAATARTSARCISTEPAALPTRTRLDQSESRQHSSGAPETSTQLESSAFMPVINKIGFRAEGAKRINGTSQQHRFCPAPDCELKTRPDLERIPPTEQQTEKGKNRHEQD